MLLFVVGVFSVCRCSFFFISLPLSLSNSNKFTGHEIEYCEYALRIWLFVYIQCWCSISFFFFLFAYTHPSSTKLLVQRANDLFVHYLSYMCFFFSFSILVELGLRYIQTFIFPAPVEWYMRTNIFANMFCGYK